MHACTHAQCSGTHTCTHMRTCTMLIHTLAHMHTHAQSSHTRTHAHTSAHKCTHARTHAHTLTRALTLPKPHLSVLPDRALLAHALTRTCLAYPGRTHLTPGGWPGSLLADAPWWRLREASGHPRGLRHPHTCSSALRIVCPFVEHPSAGTPTQQGRWSRPSPPVSPQVLGPGK